MTLHNGQYFFLMIIECFFFAQGTLKIRHFESERTINKLSVLLNTKSDMKDL